MKFNVETYENFIKASEAAKTTKIKTYARRLTREDLIKAGITYVSENGDVYKGNKKVKFSVNRNGYLVVGVYRLDENGNKIKKPTKYKYTHKDGTVHYTDSYAYEIESFTLQRIMWAWFKKEIPEGFVIDHKNNHHERQEDYRIENLQLVSVAVNLKKDRKEATYTPTMAKKKVYTPQYVISKMSKYNNLYEDLKYQNRIETDKERKKELAEKIHKVRAALAQWKRRYKILFGDLD